MLVGRREVEWGKIHNTKRKRVPLPTYPFTHKPYWDKSINNSFLKNQNKELISEEEFQKTSELNLSYISNRILQMFEKILGHFNLCENDDFFELGGDSMAGLNLLLKIEAEFGSKITLDDIFLARDIKSIAKLVYDSRMDKSNKNLIIKLKSGSGKTPVFIIHPGNGELFHYQELISHLDIRRPIFGIQNTLLNDIDNSFPSIEKMATHYISLIKDIQPEGPYILGELSFGGVIAFEIARQLEDYGEQVEDIFLYDSWAISTPRFKDKNFFNKIYSYFIDEMSNA